jgi:hypothetical protein
MNWFRKHWFDLGGIFAMIVLAYVFTNTHLTAYQQLLWLSLVALFFHQLEEYRIAGTFPGMVNRVMYQSDIPDRYPLNAQTAVYVNVYFGWVCYFLAALLAEKAIWLGMATMLVSLGNLIAHTTVFNIKGKTLYNAGLLTSWLFFAPCLGYFFYLVTVEHLAAWLDYMIGIPLGIAFNVLGILKLIDWFADKNSPYVFEQRNLLHRDRK